MPHSFLRSLKIFLFSILAVGFLFFPRGLEVANAASLPITSTVKIIAAEAENENDPDTWEWYKSGSGFVVDANNKYILTNAHVVLEDETAMHFDKYIVCTIENGSTSHQCEHLAQLLFADVEHDLALLEVTGNMPDVTSPQPFNKPAVDLSKSRQPEVAEKITVMGFPSLGGDTITLTQGIVSGFINDSEGNPIFIKTDSQLIQGTSGGLVVDADGNFIGVPTSVYMDEEYAEIGMIITAKTVKEWVDALPLENKENAPFVHVVTPTKVVDLKAKKTFSTEIQLTWETPISDSDISGHEIMYGNEPYLVEGEAKSVITANVNNYTFTNLDPTQSYYFAVRGIDGEEEKGYYWSDVAAVNLGTDTALFSDFPLDHPNSYAVSYLKKEGIIAGYADGTFGPDKTIKRAELMKIVVLGKGTNPDPSQYRQCFSDVKDEWFAAYICYAKDQGWVAGYADGTFKPDQDVNLVESLRIIENIYELPSNLAPSAKNLPEGTQGQWFSPYLNLAVDMQIIPAEDVTTVKPGEYVSRAKTAEYLYRTILLAPFKEHYSSNKWRNSESKIIDPALLFGLKEKATYKYKETLADGKENFSTWKINKACTELKENCYHLDIIYNDKISHSAEYLVQDSKVLLIKEEMFSPYTSKGSYTDPMVFVGNQNYLGYTRSKTPIEWDQNGLIVKLFDGVSFNTFEGRENIETVLGQKDASKIQRSMNFNGEIVNNGFKTPIIMHVDQLIYMVEGIGIVKEIYSSEIETENDTFPSTSFTLELQEYNEN